MAERDAAPFAGLTWYGSDEGHWPKGSPNLVPESIPENPSHQWRALIDVHNACERRGWGGLSWSEYEKAKDGISLRTEWGPALVKLAYYHDRITVTLTDSAEEYCEQVREFTRESDAMDLYHATVEQIMRFGENMERLGWKSETD